MNKYLFDSYLSYPLMRTEDFVKQIFQAEFGCEHILTANADSLLKEESRFVSETPSETPLFDEISEDLVRINLRPYFERGYPSETLVEIMRKTVRQGSAKGLERRLETFCAMLGERIDLPVFAARRYISAYRAKGYGPVSHSAAYRLNYRPHYRVADKKLAVLLPLIARIDELLYRKLNVIVAIDGCCGSGKTFYADVLRDYYGCTVIHCDDFFLPRNMRTEERLKETGGNIHYERLLEVLAKVRGDKRFTYRKYDCMTETFTEVRVSPKRLIVVEGVYSLHDRLRGCYDASALFTVSESEQRSRLKSREGAEGYARFAKKWIPLEKKYFEALNTDGCIKIDTDGINFG